MTKVVEVKNGKVKVKSLEGYLEYIDRMMADAEGAQRAGSGACEEACEGHGGVKYCGENYATCEDGTGWLLDP